jgi:hypothetical protein
LNAEAGRILNEPDTRTRWIPIGLEPRATSPAEFDKLIAHDTAIFTKLAKAANIKAE